jgi:hypothetical protein
LRDATHAPFISLHPPSFSLYNKKIGLKEKVVSDVKINFCKGKMETKGG